MNKKIIEKSLLSLQGNPFNFNPLEINQSSDEWLHMKLGVISASSCKKLMSKPTSETYRTYISSLVAQICTAEMHEISSRSLDWGKSNEDAARASYEFMTGFKVHEYSFIYGDESLMYGCSPDGLVFRQNGTLSHGIEIKCPYDSANFIKFIAFDFVKPEHELQCQMSMLITGADEWHYGNYDPRMKKNQLHWFVIERDDEQIDQISERIVYTKKVVTKTLESLGHTFGDQWS